MNLELYSHLHLLDHSCQATGLGKVAVYVWNGRQYLGNTMHVVLTVDEAVIYRQVTSSGDRIPSDKAWELVQKILDDVRAYPIKDNAQTMLDWAKRTGRRLDKMSYREMLHESPESILYPRPEHATV